MPIIMPMPTIMRARPCFVRRVLPLSAPRPASPCHSSPKRPPSISPVHGPPAAWQPQQQKPRCLLNAIVGHREYWQISASTVYCPTDPAHRVAAVGQLLASRLCPTEAGDAHAEQAALGSPGEGKRLDQPGRPQCAGRGLTPTPIRGAPLTWRRQIGIGADTAAEDDTQEGRRARLVTAALPKGLLSSLLLFVTVCARSGHADPPLRCHRAPGRAAMRRT